MKELLADKYLRLKNELDDYKMVIAEQIYPGCKDLVGKTIYECRSRKQYPTDEFYEWKIDKCYGITAKDSKRHEVAKLVGGYSFPSGGRVTKKLIAECEEYVRKYRELPVDAFDVFFSIVRYDEKCKTSSGLRYSPETGFERNFGLNKSDFDEKIKADKEEYERTYKPREGYVKCERCGKQVPENEVVKYKLIYQAWDHQRGRYVTSRIGTFCSGDCALNEQMSLEG